MKSIFFDQRNFGELDLVWHSCECISTVEQGYGVQECDATMFNSVNTVGLEKQIPFSVYLMSIVPLPTQKNNEDE